MEDTHVAVLLEDIRGQFKAFGEDLQGVRAQLSREITKVSGELEHMGRDLGRRIGGVAKDVAILKTDVAVLKTDVADVKIRLTGVENRLTGVEERLNGAPPPSPVRKRRK
jgi:predicted phage tail protein